MTNSASKELILSILGISILIVAVIGISYAVFATTLGGTKENMLSTGTISMSYTESTNGISITNAMPMDDAEGKKLVGVNDVFDFAVSAEVTGVTTINYEVVAEKIAVSDSEINNSDIRIYLQKEATGSYVDTLITATPKAFIPSTTVSVVGSPIGSMLLYAGEFSNDVSKTNTYSEKFRLRMWLSNLSEIDAVSKSFKIKVNVYAKVL